MQHKLRCISRYNAVSNRGMIIYYFLKLYLHHSVGAPIAMNKLVYKV